MRLSISLVIMWIFIGCGPKKVGSKLDHLSLRFKNGASAVIYRKGAVVKYRQCDKDSKVKGRNCKTNREEIPKSFFAYKKELAAEFKVDQDIIDLGTPENLTLTIANTTADIDSGKLTPEEMIDAQDYLKHLERNQVLGEEVLKVIVALDEGTDLNLNENYSKHFRKVLAPFLEHLPTNHVDFWGDPRTGIAWAKLGKRCWYDAMDRKRPKGYCMMVTVNIDSDLIYFNNDYNSGVDYAPQKGCKRQLGPSWGLAKISYFETVHLSNPSYSKSWTIDGESINSANYFNYDYIKKDTFSKYISDHKLAILPVTCFAKVKDVDPEGDVDSDGVLNRLDQCNRLPDDLTSLIDTEGERVGCAKGQSNDTEFFNQLDAVTEDSGDDKPDDSTPDAKPDHSTPGAKPVKIPNYWGDKHTGLAWVNLGKMCWYDAMDLRSPERCISSGAHTTGGVIRIVSPDKRVEETKKGCQRDLGVGWSLPSYSQLESVVLFKKDYANSWLENGSYVDYNFDKRNSSWSLDTKIFSNVSDAKLVTMPVKCVARAKDIDPKGDIDGDGIPNGKDQCNRVPDDLKLDFHTEGEWIGCAKGQSKDSDL